MTQSDPITPLALPHLSGTHTENSPPSANSNTDRIRNTNTNSNTNTNVDELQRARTPVDFDPHLLDRIASVASGSSIGSPIQCSEDWAISGLDSDIDEEWVRLYPHRRSGSPFSSVAASPNLQDSDPSLIMPSLETLDMARQRSSLATLLPGSSSSSLGISSTGSMADDNACVRSKPPHANESDRLRILVAGASQAGKTGLIEILASEFEAVRRSARRRISYSFSEWLLETDDVYTPQAAASTSIGPQSTPTAASVFGQNIQLHPSFESPQSSTQQSLFLPSLQDYPNGQQLKRLISRPRYDFSLIDCCNSPDSPEYAQLLRDLCESRLQETAAYFSGIKGPAAVAELDRLSLLRCPLIDCCIYVFKDTGPTERDLQNMKQISEYLDIIPVLGRADQISDLDSQKKRVMDQLQEFEDAILDPFDPSFNVHAQVRNYTPGISAISIMKEYNMDLTASVVESAGYRDRVLVESDLEALALTLFSRPLKKHCKDRSTSKFMNWVEALHIRSSLHARLARPLLIPDDFYLDNDSIFGGLQVVKGDHMLADISQLTEKGKSPLGYLPVPGICLSCQRTTDQVRSALVSISENDPLQLDWWIGAACTTAVVAGFFCGIGLARFYLFNAETEIAPSRWALTSNWAKQAIAFLRT